MSEIAAPEAIADSSGRDLIIALARALHEAGFSSHLIETRLQTLAVKLGLTLDLLSLPSGILLTVMDGTKPETYLLRTKPGGVNLERMSRLICTTDRTIDGTLSPSAAKADVQQAVAAPPRWGAIPTVCAYLLSAGAFSVFFGGGKSELCVASIVGLVVGVLSVVMRRYQINSRLFELIAAAGAAFVAELASHAFGACVEWIPLAAGLIILLPGIALLDAVTELSHGQLVSGSARLAGVGVAFLALGFGAVAGNSIAELIPGVPTPNHSDPLGPAMTFIALVVVTFGSMIRFRATPRDLPVIFGASLLAFYVTRWETEHMGGLAGPFLAAFLLGTAGNIYARVAHSAAEFVIIPGIALLVPGSVGILSLSALLSQNAVGGIESAFQMFLIAMALAAGILFSQSLVRDNRATA
jgi:uncharacterized membrane protein YjjP (DUF1212 family)